MAAHVINYKPPPTVRAFIRKYLPGKLFYNWIVGPVGSGKTTGLFFKLVNMAKLQKPGPDGIRRTRAVVVRNTLPQLRDTTIASWNYWFKDGVAGEWHATRWAFTLRFGDVECEVLFRPLDTPDDVARVLSLEVTFAIIDEFVNIPQKIIEALSARCGRYPNPSMVEGGATNWGMWGSSNPDTEDNWWFDHLHDREICEPVRLLDDPDAQRARDMILGKNGQTSFYFKQPSGLSTKAENIENLPGKAEYYTNQVRGKSEAWIRQFVHSEWGYSAEGTPVIGSFNPVIHVSNTRLLFNRLLPLVIGIDPGLGGSALVFGQQDLSGRLNVLAELTQAGYGAERLMTERLRPFMRSHFPDAERVILAPDPAAGNRSQTDERAVVEVLKRFYAVSIESNNRLPLRLDAIEYFTSRLTEGKPALQIDEAMCPVLIRALKGGWRYILSDKKGGFKSAEPEDNQYTHVGDGFGYLCRYFHRGAEKEARYKARPIPISHQNNAARAYHAR